MNTGYCIGCGISLTEHNVAKDAFYIPKDLREKFKRLISRLPTYSPAPKHSCNKCWEGGAITEEKMQSILNRYYRFKSLGPDGDVSGLYCTECGSATIMIDNSVGCPQCLDTFYHQDDW